MGSFQNCVSFRGNERGKTIKKNMEKGDAYEEACGARA
jgi:hypothetical protein